MTVGELKAKLAKINNDLPVSVDASEIKLGDLGMSEGHLDVTDAKLGGAFGYGQALVISVSPF